MYKNIFKPLLDYLLFIIVLPIWLPLMLIIALIIFTIDGWPLFFIQKRPGKDNAIFNLIKFRTMNVNGTGNNINRITRLGKFLRSSSLDEIPSFINIFLGHMSFIGPRPLLVEYLERYSSDQIKRHNVKPGITGLAQVNGRNAISWSDKLRFDQKYALNISFALDVKILIHTFMIVLKREGINSSAQETMEEFNNDKR